MPSARSAPPEPHDRMIHRRDATTDATAPTDRYMYVLYVLVEYAPMYQSLAVFSSSEKRHSHQPRVQEFHQGAGAGAREAGEHAPVYEIEEEYY